MSEAIGRLVNLAKASGLEGEEGEWSKAYVYWFDGLMPDEVRSAGNADSSLEYISSDDSPHNPPDEGFIDRTAGKAISFQLRVREAK